MIAFLFTALYLATAVMATFGNYLVLGCLVIVFSIRFNTVVLVPLAFALDGYYGAFHTFPMLSMLSILWYVGTETLRPRMVLTRSQL